MRINWTKVGAHVNRWRFWWWRWWLPIREHHYGVTHVWWGPFHAYEGKRFGSHVGGIGWR